MPTNYQYLVQQLYNPNSHELTCELNKWAKEDFEFMQATQSTQNVLSLYFKREKTEAEGEKPTQVLDIGQPTLYNTEDRNPNQAPNSAGGKP